MSRAGVRNPLLAILFIAGLGTASGGSDEREAGAGAGPARRGPLAIRRAAADRTAVERYGRIEWTVDLEATYDNPFDPDEIDLHADLVSPTGERIRVNGFMDRPFARRLVGGRERIEPAGDPLWKIRFSTGIEGRWTCRISARDRTGTSTLPESAFQVAGGSGKGFIRLGTGNPRCFAFEDGSPFFAVGENLCWGGARGTHDYDDWLAALAAAGGNWIRVWMSSWNCALEWSREARGDRRSGEYQGAGRYSLDNAWKLDLILDAADRRGIAVQLCLGTYGEFKDGGFFNEGQWKGNPYNAANGGPCTRPEEFWTDERARTLYRRRLRYLSARYGWRANLHAWELWNEAEAPAAWVAEMARFLKGTGDPASPPADPHRHLVSTTYGNAQIWALPEIDFSQTHRYGEGDLPDHAPLAHQEAAAAAASGKPHLLAEFGIDWRKSDLEYDRQGKGINLHNALWSSMVSGDAGAAMIWWWDSYIHPRLYGQFAPVRRFADEVPWNAGPWGPLDLDPARVRSQAGEPQELALAPTGGWERGAEELSLSPEGGVRGGKLPRYLFAPKKADLRTTPTFRVELDRSGRFELKVDTVSDRARLRFLLDGRQAHQVDLSASPPAEPGGKPEYERTEFKKEHGVYQARFGKVYGIEIPAGRHAIRLEVDGGDWLSIESLRVTGFQRPFRPADVNLYGLRLEGRAILWAQNAAHSWKNVREGKPVPVIRGAETTLRGLPPGRYRVEWWDTWKGGVLRRNRAEATDAGLRLALPALETDIAARVLPE